MSRDVTPREPRMIWIGVLVAAGRGSPDPGALPLNERIGADGGSVREHATSRQNRSKTAQALAAMRIAAACLRRILGCDGDLVAVTCPRGQAPRKRERAADVDADEKTVPRYFFSGSNSNASCESVCTSTPDCADCTHR